MQRETERKSHTGDKVEMNTAVTLLEADSVMWTGERVAGTCKYKDTKFNDLHLLP